MRSPDPKALAVVIEVIRSLRQPPLTLQQLSDETAHEALDGRPIPVPTLNRLTRGHAPLKFFDMGQLSRTLQRLGGDQRLPSGDRLYGLDHLYSLCTLEPQPEPQTLSEAINQWLLARSLDTSLEAQLAEARSDVEEFTPEHLEQIRLGRIRACDGDLLILKKLLGNYSLEQLQKLRDQTPLRTNGNSPTHR